MALIEKTKIYFREFNELFFNNKLNNVRLEFSDKMRNSAGIFYPARNQEKFAKIRLNHPMLSIRSDKEIMETLLVRSASFNLSGAENSTNHVIARNDSRLSSTQAREATR